MNDLFTLQSHIEHEKTEADDEGEAKQTAGIWLLQ